MPGRGRGALFLAATLLLTACAPASPVSVPSAHPTIVSLNPCTDAILAEVAEPAQLRSLSAWSNDPASSSMDVALARRFPANSGTVEEVAALRPDVVVSADMISPPTRTALARLGIPLVEVPIAATVPESMDQIRQLARLTGHPERGEALITRIETALRAAAPSPSQASASAIVWQSGGIVPGANTLIADLLHRTGFASLSAARGLRQADYLPLEQMLADPPRVILAASDGHSGEDRLLRHPALASLTGTARVSLDPSLLWCGGPTIIRAAARLAQVRRGLK